MLKQIASASFALLLLPAVARAASNAPIILDANATPAYVNDGSNTNRLSPGMRLPPRRVIVPSRVTTTNSSRNAAQPVVQTTNPQASPPAGPAAQPGTQPNFPPQFTRSTATTQITPNDGPVNRGNSSNLNQLDVIPSDEPPAPPPRKQVFDAYGQPLGGE